MSTRWIATAIKGNAVVKATEFGKHAGTHRRRASLQRSPRVGRGDGMSWASFADQCSRVTDDSGSNLCGYFMPIRPIYVMLEDLEGTTKGK